MAEQINQVLKNAEDLRDRLKILVEETGAYKATREELSKVCSTTKDLSAEVKALLNSIKTLVDTLGEIDFGIIQKIDSTVSEIKQEVQNIDDTVGEVKQLSDDTKEQIFTNAAMLKKIDSNIIDLTEKSTGIIDSIKVFEQKIEKSNKKLFITGLGASAIIVILIIISLFI